MTKDKRPEAGSSLFYTSSTLFIENYISANFALFYLNKKDEAEIAALSALQITSREKIAQRIWERYQAGYIY